MRRIALLLIAALIPSIAFAGGSTAPGIVQSGTITPGNCAQFSANGVAIDAGSTCGTGTAGVIQSQGTAGKVLVNGDTGAHTGATTYSLPDAVTIGTPSTASGSLTLDGLTSGSAVISVPAVAGTTTFQLPVGNGTSGFGLGTDGSGHLSYVQFLAATNNLSDLGSASTARTNLGLGTAATQNTGTSGATLGLLNASLTFGGSNAYGTPASITLTNATGLPLGGITGFGTGVATWLGTPSSANLLAALTTKTGTGNAVFGTSPTISAPTISGVPVLSGLSAGTQVSCLGLDVSNNVVLNAAACGTGSGGGSAFNAIMGGTNTTAAMVVGTGATLGVSGSGTIGATTLLGQTWANPGIIGGSTPAAGHFTSLSTTVTQNANTILAGPTSGSAAAPAFRLAVSADLPGVVDTTKTASYTVNASETDIGNALNLAATTGTPALTLPTASASIFAPGQTLAFSTCNSTVNWTLTNSTGLTLHGLNSTTLPPCTQGTLVANTDTSTLDFFPGCQVATTTALGCVMPDGATLAISNGVLSTASTVVAGTTQTVTTAKWAAGTTFAVTTASQTITLPVSSTLAINGGIIVQTIGQSATLAPNASDAINGGSAGSSVTIASGLSAYVTTDGAGNIHASPIAASSSTGANPTATASDTAVNGSATTFMRSDAAPAVQKGSSSVFGVVKVDNTTITASGGVITAVGGAATSVTAGTTTVGGTCPNGDNLYNNSGVVGCQANGGGSSRAAFNANPTAPTGTTSMTYVMMGLGSTCTVTPSASGDVLLMVGGLIGNTTGLDGGFAQLYYGTSTAPSNGASPAGTATSSVSGASPMVSAGSFTSFNTTSVVKGLTPSTAYWFDVGLEAAGGGTVSIANITCSALEN